MKVVDCIIIGGGIAGLQAAIQMGRYKHSVLVIDSNQGRSTITRGYHNILGWPDGISGPKLRSLGKQQAEKYGVSFINDKVITLEKYNNTFTIRTLQKQTFSANTVFLATGLKDRLPDLPNLQQCLGGSIFICPDCDGYEITDKKTIVFGSGNTVAKMAITLTYWSKQLTIINHDKSEISEENRSKLKALEIPIIDEPISEIVLNKNKELIGFFLHNGDMLKADRGFCGFNGNQINNNLAKQIGVQLNESNHVVVNPRTKETNIKGIFAGGDLISHSEQVTISMGDGSQAAIWMHKQLLGESRAE
ncbi:NAD(P)/FAD-dependent oxidoreductase [Peribacillus huizhouensis]|uniref:Thioredoxin reductase n=1 Tax=Peribacillus huizhouensis TaxID=1501239 RepID=A0ABR6CPW1_9BACI|nr:NAD(P)/FAD-dependent oxidoreductase [Peribacillus huizhouensis]MBA9027005.1 thioredoxin reductase [Peribacillus huizhouensis]